MTTPESTSAGGSSVTLGELLQRVRQKRGRVIAITLGMGLALGAYTFFKAPYYESRAKVVIPVEAQKSGVGQLLSIGRGPSIYSVLVGLVDSETARERIGKPFGLSTTQVERLLRVDDMDNTSQIGFVGLMRKPEDAQALVQGALNEMETLARTLRIDRATRQADALRDELDAAKAELVIAEASVLEYQTQSKTVPVPTSPDRVSELTRRREEALANLQIAKSSVDELRRKAAALRNPSSAELPKGSGIGESGTVSAKLRADLVQSRVELSSKLVELGDDHPDVAKARENVSVLEQALQRELNAESAAISEGVDRSAAEAKARLDLAEATYRRLEELATAAPTEFAELNRLYFAAQNKAEVVSQLTERYQQERVSASVNEIAWSVLDPPSLPTEPSNKDYVRDVSIGLVAGLVISLFTLRKPKAA